MPNFIGRGIPKYRITIPGHYAFTLESHGDFTPSQEDAAGFAGGILLVKGNGCYYATGKLRDLEDWVNERVTNDDPESTDEIMALAEPELSVTH